MLGLACSEQRPGEREERVGIVDADRAHRQGAASRWPPSTGSTIPVTNAVRQQEPDRRGDLFGRTDASCGERVRQPVEHRIAILGGHPVPGRRRDDARRDGVDAHGRELDRERADEGLEGAVHGRRRGAAAHRRRCCDARDEDDRLPNLRSLDGRERSPELRLEGRARGRQVDRLGRPAGPCDGREDEMVDRAERGEGLAHGRLVRDVEGDSLGVDVGALGLAAEDHDVPAGVDREPRRSQADARRASDECRSHRPIIA